MNSEDRKKIHELVDQIIDLFNKNRDLELSADHITNIIVKAVESASERFLSQDG